VADAERLEQLRGEATEAAGFIGAYVVQAKLNDRGNYGARA
jgi:hypothetical protein